MNLTEFQEGARNFLKDFQIPDKYNNYSEWLTLIQHYGGKTRLLDFTYSFPMALYFAIDSTLFYKNAAVWIITPSLIDFEANFDKIFSDFYKLSKSEKYYEFNIKSKGLGIIRNIKSKRIMYQQGALIYGKNFLKSFTENLLPDEDLEDIHEYFEIPEFNIKEETTEIEIFKQLNNNEIIKIEIPAEHKGNIQHLLQQSNINSWTVFPDFQGFVKKLFFPAQPYIQLHRILSLLPSDFSREEKEEIREIFEDEIIEKQENLLKFLNKFLAIKFDCKDYEVFEKKKSDIVKEYRLYTFFTNLRKPEKDEFRFYSIWRIFEILVYYYGKMRF
ncbi:hypothetical protein ES708_16728 [subsurface metagenome]